MSDFGVVQFVQKIVKERREGIVAILENNGISSMEQYRSLMGEINALSFIEQELSGLLEKQEQFDDRII